MSDKPDKQAILVQEMETFLRSGGHVSYDEWSELEDDTKAALLVASKKIQVDRACQFSYALEGDTGRARIRAEIYGTDDIDQLSVGAALDAYEVRVA